MFEHCDGIHDNVTCAKRWENAVWDMETALRDREVVVVEPSSAPPAATTDRIRPSCILRRSTGGCTAAGGAAMHWLASTGPNESFFHLEPALCWRPPVCEMKSILIDYREQ